MKPCGTVGPIPARDATRRLARGAAAAVTLVAATFGTAGAAERAVVLKPGPGSDLVASRCASCHSLDYVLINSPFLSAQQWQASVTKMRSFGAPLTDEEAQAVVAYLAAAYGRPAG
jgi:mono/diheme cytochrome c family protein